MRTGSARQSTSLVCAGAEAFERWRRGRRLFTPDPAAFRVVRRQVDVDGFEVVGWSTSALAGEIGGREADRAVSIDFLTAGRARYSDARRTHDAGPGTAHLLPAFRAVPFAVPEASSIVRLVVPLELLPEPIVAALDDLFGPLQPTSYLDALRGLLESIIGTASEAVSAPSRDALRRLTIAALDEQVRAQHELSLRDRMLVHIEYHLTEPTLDPAGIALAFRISLRWAHHVFDAGGVGIGRHIRVRRCVAAAVRIRQGGSAGSLTELATRLGFSGRDQLAEAFRDVYGCSLGSYVHRARATQDLREARARARRQDGRTARPGAMPAATG